MQTAVRSHALAWTGAWWVAWFSAACVVACQPSPDHGPSAELDLIEGDAEVGDVDRGELAEALACEVPALTSTCAFGLSDGEGCFEPLGASTALEIVHGIQGGLHVEVRLGVASTSAHSLGFEVELVHDEVSLARFASELTELHADQGFASTPAFPLIFASVDPALYHGLSATLRGTLTAEGQRLDLPPVEVLLVDPSLPPPGEPP